MTEIKLNLEAPAAWVASLRSLHDHIGASASPLSVIADQIETQLNQPTDTYVAPEPTCTCEYPYDGAPGSGHHPNCDTFTRTAGVEQRIRDYATMLHKSTGVVPSVDVAWMLRQILSDPNAGVPDAPVVATADMRLRPTDTYVAPDADGDPTLWLKTDRDPLPLISRNGLLAAIDRNYFCNSPAEAQVDRLWAILTATAGPAPEEEL